MSRIIAYVFDAVDVSETAIRDFNDALERITSKGQMYGVQIIVATKYEINNSYIKRIKDMFEIINEEDFKDLYYCNIIEDVEVEENEECIKKQNEDEKVEEDDENDDTDPFLEEAIESVIESGYASVAFIHDKFNVGYARAR